jgi:hypothetical protein
MKTNSFLMLAAITAIFSGCSSTSRFDFEEKIENPVEKIIYYASLSGNSHNTQPWYVEIESDSVIYLYADFSRKLHIVDPDARGLFISLGAFIENLNLAAGSLGYNTDIRTTANFKSDSSAAIIRISRATESGYGLSKIENRRTLRTPFKNDEIKKEHLDKLIYGSSNIHFYRASSIEGKFIAEQTLAAYTQQSKDEQAKQEQSNWMRYSNAQEKKYRDGLTTSGMGITGFGGFFVRNFYKPEDSMKDSFIEAGIEKAKEQVENCGGWIVITQNEDTPEKWMNTGRLYQGMNLSCRDMMIGMHPMNQMIEEVEFEKIANEKLGLPGVVQFVARIGYVDSYPPANSVRRPVTDIIRKLK